MDKNKLSRAVKLYIKAAANPFMIGTIILCSGALLALFMALFVVETVSISGKDFTTMLSAMQMGKVGIYFTIMIGNLKIYQNKFYASCCCGKALYTVAPIITGLAVSLIYDIALSVITAVNLGSAGLSVVLVLNSMSDALLIMVSACYGKKKLTFGFIIPYIMFFVIPGVIGKLRILDGTLELSVGLSAAIAASVYVVSVTISLVIVNAWWKKGDRFTMPNKFILNATGNQ